MTNLQLAKLAAQKAGKFLLKEFKQSHLSWSLKRRHEIVTGADAGSEKIILSLFKKYTPHFAVLSEEAGFNKIKSDYLWVVDPLDGTTNFKVHNPLFAVSIALYYKGQPQLGVIYAPYLNELFIAEKGKGAFMNGHKLKVSTTKDLNKSFLTYCHGQEDSHMRRAMNIYRYFKMRSIDMRRLGSAVIELAWVAAGRTDSIMIPGCRPWDGGAGVLLVTEAGGKVTDFKNKPWQFVNHKTGKVCLNMDLLATNNKLHQVIIKSI